MKVTQNCVSGSANSVAEFGSSVTDFQLCLLACGSCFFGGRTDVFGDRI